MEISIVQGKSQCHKWDVDVASGFKKKTLEEKTIEKV